MLIHQSLSELLLIISKLVLIEIKFLIGWDVRRLQFLRQNSLRIDATNPRMKQDLL